MSIMLNRQLYGDLTFDLMMELKGKEWKSQRKCLPREYSKTGSGQKEMEGKRVIVSQDKELRSKKHSTLVSLKSQAYLYGFVTCLVFSWLSLDMHVCL